MPRIYIQPPVNHIFKYSKVFTVLGKCLLAHKYMFLFLCVANGVTLGKLQMQRLEKQQLHIVWVLQYLVPNLAVFQL